MSEERLNNLEEEVQQIRDFMNTMESRIEAAIERLSRQVNDLEYHGLNDAKNDIYSLERRLDSLEREVNSVQRDIRYR